MKVEVEVNNLVIVKKFLTKVVEYLKVSELWSNIRKDYEILLSKDDLFLEELIESDYTKQRKILRENNLSFHCDDIIRTAKKGVVSINYGAWNRYSMRDIFKDKIKTKQEFVYKWRKGYDNSIACKKVNDVMCAWYSMEYKGLGNGHYYIAIDERHAFYCETD